MDDRSKEIRRILTGFITQEMDGAVITAAQNLFRVRNDSFFNGADFARYFGLHTEMHQYTVEEKELEKTRENCVKAFFCLGRRAYLYTAPDTLAMLYRPAWHNPMVVTFDAENTQLLLCIYTARSPLAKWHSKRAMKALNELLPKNLKETEVTMKPYCATADSEKKQETGQKQDEKPEEKPEE